MDCCFPGCGLHFPGFFLHNKMNFFENWTCFQVFDVSVRMLAKMLNCCVTLPGFSFRV